MVYRWSFLNMLERPSNIDSYFLNLIWQDRTPPESWQKAIIVQLHKKGDIKKCENYRGIGFLTPVINICQHHKEQTVSTTKES
jgi:hypothetical protein